MAAVLTLDNVSLCYQRGRRSTMVLHDIDLTLMGGEIAGVWGRRGAGKSTLTSVAAGVLKPDRGEALLDGAPLVAAGSGILHPQIGLANRRGPELDEMPVEDWIASSLLLSHPYKEALTLARRALERTGAIEIGGEPWDVLSDGERMLVSLAQAIVRGPRVLIADDPLAGLGAIERDEVMQLLSSIAGTGVAVLVTAAELVELRGLDRIWSLRDGRLDGPSVRPGGTVIPLRADG
jgi:ABC-type multidrug transport system ATPase subunit